MINQPLIADEVDFIRASTNWAQDKGEVTHPPGYVHILQLSYAIFGRSDAVARLPGIACGLLTLLLLPSLVRVAYGDSERARRISIVAVWLFTLNPFTSQNMILLDIDTTVLTAAVLIAVWAWYCLQTSPAWQRVAVLSLIFYVSLWFKLTTPPVLLLNMIVTYFLRGQLRRAGEMAHSIYGL